MNRKETKQDELILIKNVGYFHPDLLGIKMGDTGESVAEDNNVPVKQLDARIILGWVKTADRLPDKCDETKYLIARQRICGDWHTLQVTGLYIKKYPTRCPWWMPIPPLPEVEE